MIGKKYLILILTFLTSMIPISGNSIDTKFLHSAFKNDLTSVKELLQQGANINHQSKTGTTALIGAISLRHEETAQYLIQHGADLNIQDSLGRTALMKAANNGSINLSQILISHHADLNITDKYGANAFMWAVHGGNIQIVRLLHSKGINVFHKGVIWVNQREGSYFGNALTIAAGKPGPSMLEILQYLVLECGIDINDEEIDVKTGEDNGWTPFLSACVWGDIDRIKFLIENGADIQISFNGNTALHYASGSGKEEIVKLLLSHGLSADTYSNKGISVLINAITSRKHTIVKALLENGADVNKASKLGVTPLLVACSYGDSSTVSLLLKQGADVNKSDSQGITPLMIASQRKYPFIVEQLLKENVAINAQTEKGKTALNFAVNSGDEKIVTLLMAYQADINIGNVKGQSPLIDAIRNGKSKIAELLIEQGADVNAVSTYESTPLITAVNRGNFHLVRLLISHGANINYKDNSGNNALLKAYSKPYYAIGDYLLNHGIEANTVNIFSDTPLSYLISFSNSPTNQDSIYQSAELLIQNGLDVTFTDRSQSTYLHEIARREFINIPLVQLLLKNKIPINKENHLNQTALHVLCRSRMESNNSHKEFIELLLSHNIDHTIRDNFGQRAFDAIIAKGVLPLYFKEKTEKLLLALSENRDKEFKKLLNEGTNIHHLSQNSNLILDNALLKNDLNFFNNLLSGTDISTDIEIWHGINDTTEMKMPLLFAALHCGSDSIVSLILKGNPNLEERLNISPFIKKQIANKYLQAHQFAKILGRNKWVSFIEDQKNGSTTQ